MKIQRRDFTAMISANIFFLNIIFGILFCVPASAAAPSDLEQKLGPRPIDGAYVEAVQSYLNPKQNNWGFDFGLWPLNPYFNGFSVDGHYTRYFNKDRAWEVINLAYVYTVDTNLTTELAADNSLTPQVIERPNIIISSNYMWTLAYGKFVFLENNVRYFRSSALAGPVYMATNLNGYLGICLGISVETFVNEKTSWQAQIRDNYMFGNTHPHSLVLVLGTNRSF